MTRSNFSKNSKSYQCLNCLLTKKGQTISFIILSIVAVALLVGLFFSVVYYNGFLITKAAQEYNIEAAMKSGLMMDCEYIVTPWYLNFCQNQDDIDSYAWRQFKLLKTDKPDCVDVHERTPCRDSNITIIRNRNRTILWPSTCPKATLEEGEDGSLLDFGDITEVSREVKMPLIADLKPYLNQTIRSMDLFMICPNCFFRGCDNDGYWLFSNIRHGWPHTFADCSYFNITSKVYCEYFKYVTYDV